MAAARMIVEALHEDDIFGIALSSPGLCSPGLEGDQGWSPCSSVYEDSFDDANTHRAKKDSAASVLKTRRHTMAWPMPPIRVPATRPLSFCKERHNTSSKQRPGSASSSSSSSGLSSMSESSAATLPDGVVLPNTSPLSVMKSKQLSSGARRYFSLPAEAFMAGKPLDIAFDEVHVFEGDEERAFDETLPLMPVQDLADWHDADEEEQVKMNRLQASFSLLGVAHGPRAGHYSPTSSKGSRDDSECSSPAGVTGHSDQNSPVDGDDGHSPTAGLCLLRMALSPEHKAPTLAEQMAFATGLGSMCAWASPMRSSYAVSPDQHFLHTHGMPPIQSVRSVAQSASLTTVEQHERQLASRHIRQNVAASATLLRSQSKASDAAYSSYNDSDMSLVDYMPQLDHGDVSDGEDNELFSSKAQHCGQEAFERYVRSSTPALHSVGHHSIAASTVISANSSPIMHGALSALTFDSVSAASPSLAKTTAEPLDSTDAGHREIHSASQSCSPILQHEFSYLAHNDAFLMSMQSDGPRPIVVNAQQESYWPDANGFNGNTLSPCLTTPELGLRHTPAPLSCGPSPYLADASISGIEPIEGSEQYDMPGSFTASARMPSSSSMSSVLQRPHPIASSRSASFFAHADVTSDHHREARVQKRISRCAKAEKEVEAAIALPSEPLFNIPMRKASLDMETLVKERPAANVRASVSFKDEPHPRHLLHAATVASTTASMMPTRMTQSMSTGSLGPKALAQVREACRVKAVYLRNGKSLDSRLPAEHETDVGVPPVPSVPIALRTSSDIVTPTMVTTRSTSTSSICMQAEDKVPTTLAAATGDAAVADEAAARSTRRSKQFGTTASPTARLPTLYIARTPSQRKRGATGIPATEPRTLAMAKMGMPITSPTRTSTVQALSKLDAAMDEIAAGAPTAEKRRSSRTDAVAQLDPALAIEAHLRSSLDNMPEGFVLVVEQKKTVVSHVNDGSIPY